jgi:hypothetical protein
MEALNTNQLLEHLIRFIIIMVGIGFAVYLGRHRPEWRSRKTLICWVWTMVATDIMIMNGDFSKSFSAQLFIGGALILNVINFIGDRIETIKFKDFSASLKTEDANEKKHSIKKKKEPVHYVTEDPEAWPDGGTLADDPPKIDPRPVKF